MPLRHTPYLRNGNAEKTVAVAVLPFAGFEKTGEHPRFFGIGQRRYFGLYICGFYHRPISFTL